MGPLISFFPLFMFNCAVTTHLVYPFLNCIVVGLSSVPLLTLSLTNFEVTKTRRNEFQFHDKVQPFSSIHLIFEQR